VPRESIAKSVVVIAAMPLENSRHASAPSSAATFSSATRCVGLPYRPYSTRSILPSKWSLSSCVFANVYVAVCTIGVTSELASFGRASPPWTAVVLGPSGFLGISAIRTPAAALFRRAC
jgi:hypothetical protein